MDPLARYESIVPEYSTFRDICDRELPHLVRVNPIKTTIERTKTALTEAAVQWSSIKWDSQVLTLETDQPGATWPYVLGWIHGQEAVSGLPAQVLDPRPSDRIFDPCAAPGSKTSQLAAIMGDRGRIVANDANLGRISALRANLDRLGVTNTAVTNQDARNYSLKPFDGTLFDGAVVDVPCSGEGTIRKNPTALDNWSVDYLKDIAELQVDILRRSIEVTRPGGEVVYSTCTFAPEENEAVIDAVLSSHPCQIRDIDLPLTTADGITDWQNHSFDDRLTRAKRIWPHQNDTGGFFVAALEVTA